MKMKGIRGVLAGFLCLAVGSAAAADAVDRLRQFVASAKSAEGEFRQTVIGETGRPSQQAAGKFAFARPGKFRWEYDLPYPQLLVSDGQRLWSWDRDLKQVTVRPLSNALGATPAAILFGQDAIERDFDLTEGAPDREGSNAKLVWVEARPRQTEASEANTGSGFQLICFGFDGNRLQRLLLRDNFGQTTVIEFTHLTLNPRLAPAYFHFEPPPGVDILGDPSAVQ